MLAEMKAAIPCMLKMSEVESALIKKEYLTNLNDRALFGMLWAPRELLLHSFDLT